MLPSHKIAVTYLEHTRIVKADEKLSFLKENKGVEYTFALPFGNIAVLLLGPGTSITQSAMQHLSAENVMVGFVGGSGYPIFCGSLSEYRPSEYVQKWLSNWQSMAWRITTAKQFQAKRVAVVNTYWPKFKLSEKCLARAHRAGEILLAAQETASDKSTLLGFEANYAKSLYAALAEEFSLKFVREPKSKSDLVNDLIDTQNYYAYGLAGTALWILGIPYAFAVLHGDTRRGALVFDLADVVKDGILLPQAFISSKAGLDKSAHKKEVAKTLQLTKVLPIMLEEIKRALEPVA